MRITYDPVADAAYIYLTGEPVTPGRDSVVCDLPDGSGDLTVISDLDATSSHRGGHRTMITVVGLINAI